MDRYSYPWGTKEMLEGQITSLNFVSEFQSLHKHEYR